MLNVSIDIFSEYYIVSTLMNGIWWGIVITGATIWFLGAMHFVIEIVWYIADKLLRKFGLLGDLLATYKRMLKERREKADQDDLTPAN